MTKQAVIFDMDGVLIDSESWYFRVKQETFAETDATPQHFTLAETAGLPEDAGWALLFDDPEERAAQKKAYMTKIFSQPIDFKAILKPGVRETLVWLQAHHYRVALASAGPMPYLEMFLKSADVTDLFNEVISGEDITRNKPDPMIYLTALDRLQLPAASCVAIEDSPTGIAAATGAGIETWAVKPTGYMLDQQGADRVITGVADLQQLLS
ncbi:HAD family hydrolase [Lacticaseibacillus daqingensis]|uniref:HAD family hydrolase n=1 Tax=Lacticaseibacillus daqingensis TaxID=2486014 RepID=UPI0013DE5F6E|nr:HAD family phosphatase [Lacticaseibacillus daqingensis]